MTHENEKGGPIEAAVIFVTQYENVACRVLTSLHNSDYKERAGFVYTEGEFQIVVMGDLELSEIHELAQKAENIARFDIKSLPLSTFKQFDHII